MAQPAEPEVIATFPDPPPFARLYAGGPEAGPPPPPVPQGKVVVFGCEDTLDEPFAPPLQVPKLYSLREDGTIDFKAELLKLCRSLVFLYVELLSVLVEAPGRYPQALTGVIHTLQNIMHLTNLLRQPQARQGLEEALRQRVQRKREAVAEVRQRMAGVRQVLDTATAALVAAGGDSAESSLPRQQGRGQADGAGGAAALDTA